jgi:hypothetical protein
VAALREEYRRTRRAVATGRSDAARTVRIVATTVDQLVSDPAVYERRYDNVLVEQAGLVPAAFLLWAASLSRWAMTLATSLDERPPAPAVTAGTVRSEGCRWLTASLVELLGLDSFEAVREHRSGIVLD